MSVSMEPSNTRLVFEEQKMKKKLEKIWKNYETALGYGRKKMYKAFQMDHKVFVTVKKPTDKLGSDLLW